MKIEKIRLKNFKTFKNTSLTDLPSFCVIVGANGTGKSTLFDVFDFLKDCLTYNVTKALQARGGFDEVLSRDSAGENIEIEIQYRMSIAGRERLISYVLEIGMDGKHPCVKSEILRYKRGPYGAPYKFLHFTNGSGYAITNEEDFSKPDTALQRETQELETKDTLAIKGLGQFQRFKAASAFRQLVENWHVSDFHINAARGLKDATGFAEHLSVNGDNLQLVAKNLHDNEPKIFASILEKMQQRIPGIGGIETEDTKDGRLLLKFRDENFQDPFIDRYVSDGTIKMFAYLVLLYDPKPYPILCVEEPENQLYPRLLWELAEEFRAYAKRGGQVFVSTHSPDFLNATFLDEVFWLEKKSGCTDVKRASEDTQIAAYMNEGDQMGYLWMQGLLGEVDPQ